LYFEFYQEYVQNRDHCLLDHHRALLPADRLHRLQTIEPAAGGGGVYPPWLSRLLPHRTRVGQALQRVAAGCAGTGAAQRMGVRRLRHQTRFSARRSPLGRRWPGGWGWAVGTGVLWGLSYFFWRRRKKLRRGPDNCLARKRT